MWCVRLQFAVHTLAKACRMMLIGVLIACGFRVCAAVVRRRSAGLVRSSRAGMQRTKQMCAEYIHVPVVLLQW